MAHLEHLVLEAGDISITIDPGMGGRATAWRVEGIDLLGSRSPNPIEYGMYPMAPWAGRLSSNAVRHRGQSHPMPVNHPPWALHGTILAASLQVLAHEVATDASLLVLEGSLGDAWPWAGTCTLTWNLTPGELRTTIALSSGGLDYPAVVGWHPWFRRSLRRGGPLQVDLPAEQQMLRGPNHLPTGELVPARMDEGPFDDAFRVPSKLATLTWPGWRIIEIHNSHPWFVLFDELPDLVCVEPQSGPPDGINGHLEGHVDLVEADAPLQMETTWRVRPA